MKGPGAGAGAGAKETFAFSGLIASAGAGEGANILSSKEAGAGAGGNEISNSFSSNTLLSHDVFSELVSSASSPVNDSLLFSLCFATAICRSLSLVCFSSVSFVVTYHALAIVETNANIIAPINFHPPNDDFFEDDERLRMFFFFENKTG